MTNSEDFLEDYEEDILEEFESYDEVAEVSAMDTYYQPVKVGDFGSYGPAEIILKTAEYFDIGDVRNADWLNARAIPFGDYDSSEIGVLGGVVRYADELHWENAPRASTTPDEDYIRNDPALLWTLQEMERIQKLGQDERLKKLYELLNCIKEYDKRQRDDELHLVPTWAVEIIHYAITTGQKYDPEILTETSQPESLTYRPVGRCAIPSTSEIEQYYDICKPVEIRSKAKTWINYLDNGEKKYGPVGFSIGTTTFLRSSYIESAKEHKEYTESNMVRLLMENGLSVSKDTGEYKVSLAKTLQTEEELINSINNISNEVNRSSAILETILTYRKQVLKDLNREAALNYLSKVKRGNQTLLDVCKDVLDVKYFHQMNARQILNCLTNKEASSFINHLSTKVNDNLYILQVRNKYGYQAIAYTKDKEIANKYKKSKAIDICWFTLPAFERTKYKIPSEAGDKLEIARAIKEIESSNYFNFAGWRNFVPFFNSGHNVKTIPSLANREINWLFNQTTMNSKQIKTCKDGMYLLGAELVSIRSKRTSTSEVDRIAFFRIQDEIKKMLVNYRNKIPNQLLKKLSTGYVDVYYNFKLESLDHFSDQDLRYYLQSKQITYHEFKTKQYVNTSIKFNYKCNTYTDVFQIVNNYKLNEENLNLTMSVMNERTV